MKLARLSLCSADFVELFPTSPRDADFGLLGTIFRRVDANRAKCFESF